MSEAAFRKCQVKVRAICTTNNMFCNECHLQEDAREAHPKGTLFTEKSFQ